MSYLCTIFEFVQNLCSEDAEISNLTKEIEEFNRENSKFENQLEEIDQEHVRLQIELYNLQTIISYNDKSALENVQQISMKAYKESVELSSFIDKIDFTKILKCHHMEMEAKFLKEWKPLQDCYVKTLKWHNEMEQRHIVQKYRQVEVAYKESEETEKREMNLMKISLKESTDNLNQAKDKRNKCIVYIISGSKEIENLKEKMVKLRQYQVYIEELRKEKWNLTNQLEQAQLKAFNPNPSSNSSHNVPSKSSQTIEAIKYIIPTLPSFTDILKSFNQIEKKTNITTIENTTNICVKSILHNSSCNQTITTKQTKNVRFKVQLEEYQEDITQTAFNKETESESDLEIDVSEQQTAMEVNECSIQDENENLQEMKDLANKNEIETIDLLTPADNLVIEQREQLEDMDSSDYDSCAKNEFDKKKPLIEIQECIVFKAPLPRQEGCMLQNKENSLNVTTSSSKQSVNNSLSSHSSSVNMNDILNTTKLTFYEEFSNTTTSAEVSPNTPRNALKGFEAFFNDKEYLFGSKELDKGEKLKDIKTNNSNNEAHDFLDFDSSKGFAFDSDDNMIDNAGTMDFM